MNISLDALNKTNRAEGDFFGPDGLLYCGKCKAPKQAKIDGIRSPVFIACECMRRRQEQTEERERQKRIEDLRSYCLPLGSIRMHTFDVADDEPHIQIAREYVEKWEKVKSENRGIVFYGPVGTGKSFAAHCIANALIDREIPVRYYTAVELIAQMMEKHEMPDVTTAPLLIIDDIGAEHDSSFSRSMMCSVIDARVESKKPLIVTTNYTLQEMRGTNDRARTFDRILQVCGHIAVTGESKRQKLAAENQKALRELLK